MCDDWQGHARGEAGQSGALVATDQPKLQHRQPSALALTVRYRANEIVMCYFIRVNKAPPHPPITIILLGINKIEYILFIIYLYHCFRFICSFGKAKFSVLVSNKSPLAKRRIDDKHPIPFVVNIVRKEILKLNKSSLKVDYIKRFNINN